MSPLMTNGIRKKWNFVKDAIINSFFLSGLLILNFLFITVLLIALDLFADVQLIELTIYHPEGFYWIIFIGISTIVLAILIDYSNSLRKAIEYIPAFSWRYVSADDLNDFSKRDLWNYDRKRRLYIRYSTETLPLLLLGLTAPAIVGYIYSDPINFSAISVMFIGLGIFLGNFRTVLYRQVIYRDRAAKDDQEVSEIVAKQLESLLLLMAAATQVLGIYNIDLGQVQDIVITAALAILAVVPSFYLFYKNSPNNGLDGDD